MPKVEKSILHPVLYRFGKIICWVVFKTGWRLRVIGAANVPASGPIIIAANHRSLADPPLVGVATTRYVHFLAKEELFRFRPFGWLIRNLNAHPLNRVGSDVGAFKTAISVLKQGEAMIVFPEGRRSKTDALGPAKAGVGMLAVMTKTNVVPAYVHNSAYMRQMKRITVAFGEPMDPSTFTSYQDMADAVMRRIARLKTDLESGKI